MNNEQSPFNWKEFEKFFGGNIPFFSKNGQDQMHDNPDWVEGYVKDIMGKMMPSFQTSATGGDVKHEEFETLRDLIVKIYLPQNKNNLKLFASTRILRLHGVSEEKITISLSQSIDPSSCKASCKNNILQVQMHKESEAEMFQEVKINHI